MSEYYALADATLPPDFSAIELPVTVDKIRSILSIDQNQCLVLERVSDSNGDDIGIGNVVLLLHESSNRSGNGILDQRRIVATAPALNHGLAIHKNYLYASSDSHVYRWPYDAVAVNVTGAMETVIYNMNAYRDPEENGTTNTDEVRGNHVTRTLMFDAQDRLLISVGSIGNIDSSSFRSRIRRFIIPDGDDDNNLLLPLDFGNGEVFADGLRNEVGLAFDRHGILWGVQTGPDRLDRADLGGAMISEDNPAELLHDFRQEGLHYGYPYCWMEYNLPRENGGLGPRTMWTWPTFMDTVTDEDCRNTSRYMPAELAMQGHSSPLGMTFYEYKPQDELMAIGCTSGGAFPEWMDGYALIAFHGSWNREIPTGYKVVYVPMNATTGQVAADDAIDLLAHAGSSGAKWPDGFRPVDVDFDECGRLLVSSDGTDGFGTKVVRIDYNQELDSLDSESNSTMNDPPPTNNTTTLESTAPTSSSSSTITPPQTNTTLEKSTASTSSGSLRYCVHSSLLLPTLICMMIIARGIIR